LAQAVQNCALDAVFGVCVESDVLRAVVLLHGIEQAHHTGVNQIVQIDVDGQILVNANGNRLHQWNMVEYDLIAFLLRERTGVGGGHTCSLHVLDPLFACAWYRASCARQPYLCRLRAISTGRISTLVFNSGGETRRFNLKPAFQTETRYETLVYASRSIEKIQ